MVLTTPVGSQPFHRASEKGVIYLSKAVVREEMFIKRIPVVNTIHTYLSNNEQDKTSNTFLPRYYASMKVLLESTSFEISFL